MPKVHFVKKARKNNKKAGIKKGQSYWWWSHRMKGSVSGFKRYSLKPPRPSQLTLSEFWQAVYSVQESVEDAGPEPDDVISTLRDVANQIREAGEACDEKFNNMPDGLQQGETGQLLEARRDACSTLADQLEEVADNIESDCNEVDGDTEDETEQERKESIINERLSEIDWTFE